MKRLEIVPFKADHLNEIYFGTHITEPTMTLARFYETHGVGYAMMANRVVGSAYPTMVSSRVIGAAGIAVMVPGVGEAWSFLSDEARAHPFTLHRAVARAIPGIMRERGLRRVQVVVDPGSAASIEWILRLGFRYEGALRNFKEDGGVALLYARVT